MPIKTKTRAVFFPFELFDGGGTAAGVELLADAFRELIADNRREQMPSRARAYRGQLSLHELSFNKVGDYQKWRRRGRRLVRRILARNEFLVWIAGSHLGALPVYEELARHNSKTLILQFDAHLDIYNLTDCRAELSHGNFLMHVKAPLPQVVNIGHRELLLPPDHIARYFHSTYSMNRLTTAPEQALGELQDLCAAAERVLIDVDCDVFDPAYFPGVAQPKPYGMAPVLFLRILDALWSDRVGGLAVSEFAPAHDRRDLSLETLMWLFEHLLLRRYEVEQ